MKLEEGKRYDFLVQKTLEIGDNTYFLLKGPGNEKNLLRKEYYKDYKISINSIINCRVDKINCRGEVFLEPANPYYTEGEEYDFEISGRDIRINKEGESVPVLLLKDIYGNELVVPMNMAGLYDSRRSKSVSLKILRIIKGRIIFTEPVSVVKGEKKEEDDVLEFHIYDKMSGMDGKDYFMVSDPDNKHHLLPADQYSYYGLKKGRSFRGRFIKYHATGKYKIEPLNPYYEKGREYDFELISVNERPDGQGKVLLVIDHHGLKHVVFVPGDFTPRDKLTFRVEKIRKGRPLLVPL
ncbi:MAG TPA: hypothetical protein ENH59_08250 [Bacteroidetes bacterium]|nr:hypothetical protein [Bacteroidota bacterium]